MLKKSDASPKQMDEDEAFLREIHTDEHILERARFQCENCGSSLNFSPKSQHLACQHCGNTHTIVASSEPVLEYDFKQSLRALEQLNRQTSGTPAKHASDAEVKRCTTCAAEFTLSTTVDHAGSCPYCDSPIVESDSPRRYLHPKSLLPFRLSQKEASDSFKQWQKRLWFAPNDWFNQTQARETMRGVYLPYWTFDSHTRAQYTGLRGDIYYVTKWVTVVVNGKSQQRLKRVPKIRWTAAAGRVRHFFDDVLIGASKTLPRKIVNQLAPWDLASLTPYQEDYIIGFRSELYQVTVDQAFLQAENVMAAKMRQLVKHDIGGHQQQIHSLHIKHNDVHYKHLLLPVWYSAYAYKGKVYRYVINGRSGKVAGERPYSVMKIVLAALMAATLLGAAAYVGDRYGVFDQMLGDTSYSTPYPSYAPSYAPSNDSSHYR